MIGGRITGTIACIVLSVIGLSVSRADFRTISVSKCAKHLSQFMCVVCFMLEGFFLKGDEQIHKRITYFGPVLLYCKDSV